jgi:hypothetical protein
MRRIQYAAASPRHCLHKREAFVQEIDSDEAIHASAIGKMDCFAEPVIGRAIARPVGSQ